MKKILLIGLAVLTLAGGGVAFAVGGTAQDRPATAATAQTQTTFAIENMTCATCPITVKKAMEGVAGVSAVSVDFGAKTARATYERSEERREGKECVRTCGSRWWPVL